VRVVINTTAIYVLWLREMKRALRARSRVVASLAMPLLFLVFLGLGFNRMAVPGMSGDIRYIRFLVPGIIGMTMLFTSVMGGLSVLWDKEFGFLKEIMVAPVSRTSLVLGRIAGGATTALIQGALILGLSAIFGFRASGPGAYLLGFVFMVLVATSFLGLGLIFASRMKDMQGFSLIMNFVVFPIFFLSGALYPLGNLPPWVRILSYLDPLTYGVDGLRGALIGVSAFPVAFDLAVMSAVSVSMVALGAYFFEKSEAV
jgi:ABC-2 type transport system permease protein